MANLPYLGAADIIVAFGWTDALGDMPTLVYFGNNPSDLATAAEAAITGRSILIRSFKPFLGAGSELAKVRAATSTE
jgi:hypothetical protein